jgi:hypothetical protein
MTELRPTRCTFSANLAEKNAAGASRQLPCPEQMVSVIFLSSVPIKTAIEQRQYGGSRVADERRYGDDEVSEIFALATREGDESLPTIHKESGLTLEELQAVGREVGLAPERVSDAVATLEARAETLPRGTSLGSAVSVGRVVELPRAPTDREWQILVSELRETFRAKGRVSSHGELREWTNGRLHAYVEPTETGYRMRLGTRKTGAEALTALGSFVGLIGVLLLVTSGMDEATFGAFRATLIPALMALAGGGVATQNIFRLRRWADEREGQMEHIANRARALLGEPTATQSPTPTTDPSNLSTD